LHFILLNKNHQREDSLSRRHSWFSPNKINKYDKIKQFSYNFNKKKTIWQTTKIILCAAHILVNTRYIPVHTHGSAPSAPYWCCVYGAFGALLVSRLRRVIIFFSVCLKVQFTCYNNLFLHLKVNFDSVICYLFILSFDLVKY
jgi:hypothetical protein